MLFVTRFISFSQELLLDNLSAARRYWKHQHDLSDPLDFRDLQDQPELAIAAVRHRLNDETRDRIEIIKYPKRATSGERQMTVLDPYDQLVLRLLVGACHPQIENALRDEVLYVRSHHFRSSWITPPFGGAGRSDERSTLRHKRALECAVEANSIFVQRALIGTLYRTGGISTLAKAGLSRLAMEPELTPTVHWALAA